jgi:hypothetical protein
MEEVEDGVPGDVHRFLRDDHAHLDRLLARADGRADRIDVAAVRAAFRKHREHLRAAAFVARRRS